MSCCLIFDGLSRRRLNARALGLAIFTLLFLCSYLPESTQAQTMLPQTGGGEEAETSDPSTKDPSPNDVRELARLLSDPTIVSWIQNRADQTEAIEAQEPETMDALLEDQSARISERVARVGTALAGLQDFPHIVQHSWSQKIDGPNQLRLTILVIVFLFIGGGLEWLYWCYAGHAKRRIEARPLSSFVTTAMAASARLGLVTAGAVLFGVGAIGAFVMFDWPALARALVLELLIAIVLLRFFAAIAQFVLAPRVDALRLVPLKRIEARRLFFGLMSLVAAMLIGGGMVDALQTLQAPENAILMAEIMTLLACAGVVIFLIWRMHNPRPTKPTIAVNHAIKSRARSPWPIGRIIVTACVVLMVILWLIGMNQAAMTLAILTFVVPCAVALRATIFNAFEPRGQLARASNMTADKTSANDDVNGSQAALTTMGDDAGEPDDQGNEDEDQPDTTIYRPIAMRLGRFFTVGLTLFALALVWDIDLTALSTATTWPGRVFEVVIDVMVAFLIGDLVWVATKTAIDRKMASMPKLVHGHAPGPEARMATLLPVFKIVVLITVIVMVVLIALSSLGINIAPLLAGAGVVGLAIGFGAQALVRDIVSGVFFLIDDAFRVGEYIEMGELRGTVESISIRSLRVRHHRGAVHTIPFGELKSLTNYSRDWVMMKLEFRVPFETDLKLAKKIVKKIDAELRANPDYGDSFLEPLKFQGVRRMEEFNMVVGVKFMTKPGEQWTIRRDAYQRIRDEFDKNGIHFAQRNVKVEVIGNQPLTDEVREAAVGAAQDAIEQQAAPQPG